MSQTWEPWSQTRRRKVIQRTSSQTRQPDTRNVWAMCTTDTDGKCFRRVITARERVPAEKKVHASARPRQTKRCSRLDGAKEKVLTRRFDPPAGLRSCTRLHVPLSYGTPQESIIDSLYPRPLVVAANVLRVVLLCSVSLAPAHWNAYGHRLSYEAVTLRLK